MYAQQKLCGAALAREEGVKTINREAGQGVGVACEWQRADLIRRGAFPAGRGRRGRKL